MKTPDDQQTVNFHRKMWNTRQSELRLLLERGSQHTEAIALFLCQHATLHAAKVSRSDAWSFEDEVLDDLREEVWRRIPRNCEHSIVWCIWHLARIEDVTLNMLVAGTSQIASQEGWFERLKTVARDTGNAMDWEDMQQLSAAMDLAALRAYRMAVGRRTRTIVQGLQPEDLTKRVDKGRLQQILDEGAVLPQAIELIEYWGNRDIAGLLLMPPTRHNMVHLNEAYQLKNKRR